VTPSTDRVRQRSVCAAAGCLGSQGRATTPVSRRAIQRPFQETCNQLASSVPAVLTVLGRKPARASTRVGLWRPFLTHVAATKRRRLHALKQVAYRRLNENMLAYSGSLDLLRGALLLPPRRPTSDCGTRPPGRLAPLRLKHRLVVALTCPAPDKQV
jgi:hypothetical protein